MTNIMVLLTVTETGIVLYKGMVMCGTLNALQWLIQALNMMCNSGAVKNVL